MQEWGRTLRAKEERELKESMDAGVVCPISLEQMLAHIAEYEAEAKRQPCKRARKFGKRRVLKYSL